jgi:hypothetical protein
LTKSILITGLLIWSTWAICQPSTPEADNLLSKKGRRANIGIITFDGLKINGRVADITLDYILLDAKRYNAPAALSAYYIRNEGTYYKIDVEYIKLAIVRTRRKVARSAIGAAASGAVLAGGAVTNNPTNEGDLLDIAYATATGFSIGGVVGFLRDCFLAKKEL